MRIFHTLWTKPLRADRIPVTLLCYAISFYYAKQLGAEVVLHTDDLGANLLEFIPYDEIYVDLNEIPDKITRFWAYGKLYATAHEPLGSVHIDGDVFLKHATLKNYFTGNSDLVVQSEEGDDWRTDYTYEMTQTALGTEPIPQHLNLYHDKAYNCGVVQLNNQELKRRYLAAYFRTVEMSLADKSYPVREAMIKNTFGQYGCIIPDIVAEQQFLHELAQLYTVKTILVGDVCADGIKKGYTHLCTAAKYEMRPDLETMLGEIDPMMLCKVHEQIQQLNS